MALIDDLQDFLDEQERNTFMVQQEEGEAVTQEELYDKYRIMTPNQANYYINQYKRLTEQENEIRETGRKEIERVTGEVTMWIEKEVKSLEYAKMFYSVLLENYAQEALKDSKKKSVSLPGGTVGFKKQQNEYIYEEDLVKAALQNTPYIKAEVVTSIDKKILKKDLSIKEGKAYLEGREIPGIIVNIRDDKFEIK